VVPSKLDTLISEATEAIDSGSRIPFDFENSSLAGDPPPTSKITVVKRK